MNTKVGLEMVLPLLFVTRVGQTFRYWNLREILLFRPLVSKFVQQLFKSSRYHFVAPSWDEMVTSSLSIATPGIAMLAAYRTTVSSEGKMETTVANSKINVNSTHDRILFLDSFRAIAIIMVVGVHTLSYCTPLPEYQKKLISFIVHTISVPVFFLVDGYIFARGITFFKEYSYFRSVRKSMFRLLVPWLIFTLFYVFARYYFEISGFLKEKLVVGHSLQDIALFSYGSVYAPQMYFLVSLFLIRLFGPIFRRIILINYYAVILLLFICYLTAYKSSINIIAPYLTIDGGQEPILHAFWGIQYYFIGIVILKTSEVINLQKLFIPFVILFIVALLMRDELGNFGSVLVQYSYLIALFLLFVTIKNGWPLLDRIGKNTMGVYLIHAPIILKGVSIVLSKFISVPILNFFAILFCTFFVSYCIAISLRHIPCGTLLFGEHYK